MYFFVNTLKYYQYFCADFKFSKRITMQIKNVEGMTVAQIQAEVAKGGKFVVYQYCISIILMTFKRSSNIHFIKAGESSITPGLGLTFLTLILGWWGIPWGPIYTIGALIKNLGGGQDVTQEVMAQVVGQQVRQAAQNGGAPPPMPQNTPTQIGNIQGL